MAQEEYRVGELARKAGITVRTLHHWEDVGLLTPTGRTPSGHRLYAGNTVTRVQKIRSLKALGMGLDEIREVLEGEGPGLEDVLRSHRDRLQDQIRILHTLTSKLDKVMGYLEREGRVEEESLLDLMALMTVVEGYFTPEQLQQLEAREKALGTEAIQAAELEWPVLIAQMKREMSRGADPGSPRVQALATRWRELVQAFSGGDKGIEASLGNMYREEPGIAASQGLSRELFEYVGRAMRALE